MATNWPLVRLGDVFRLEYGEALPSGLRIPGPYVVVGSAGVVGSHVKCRQRGPGIVVGRKGSIGRITWVATAYWPIDTTFYVVADELVINLRWLYHLLGRANLASMNRATGVPGLNRDDVYSLVRPLPGLDEQRRIATLLDAIDRAIKKTEAVIAATEQLRGVLLEDLLTNGVPGWHNEWKQVPGIGKIPVCWDVVRLKQVADIQTGRAVGKTTKRAGLLTLPYLSVANVKAGYLDLSVVKTMQVTDEELRRFSLRDGDVLFTEGGDADKLGRGCVWHAEIDPCLHQNHIFAARPVPGVLRPDFLADYARSWRGKIYFLSCAKQTTNLASINSAQLKGFPLPLPSLREQTAIMDVLTAIDNRLAAEVAILDQLRKSKGILTDLLLSGRIRVPNALLGARGGAPIWG